MADIRLSMRKHANGLQPVTEMDWDVFDQIRTSKPVECEIFQYRNPKHSAKYWLLMHRIAQNSDDFNDAQEVSDWVKARLGMVRHVRSWGDSTVVALRSISYSQMSQIKFNIFYDRALFVLSEKLGYDPEALLDGEFRE